MSEPPRNPAGDAELEELGDEVIISQETSAHAPKRRTNVTTDHPTVMISDHPPPRRSDLPSYRPPRDRSEQTVVIRDRKKLEKMRREIARQKHGPGVGRGTVYLIGIAALASVAAGTLIAALVDASGAAAPAPAPAASAPEVTPPAPPSASALVPPGAIDLDALPDP